MGQCNGFERNLRGAMGEIHLSSNSEDPFIVHPRVTDLSKDNIPRTWRQVRFGLRQVPITGQRANDRPSSRVRLANKPAHYLINCIASTLGEMNDGTPVLFLSGAHAAFPKDM